MMTTQKHLTVIGATGYLAVPVIKSLLQRNVKIKAVVRDLSKAAKLLPSEVEIVQADVKDVESLKNALKGSRAVYISLNTTSLDTELPFHAEREGVINIVEAAKDVGVTQLMQIVGIDYLHEEFAIEGMVYKTNVIRKPGMEAIRQSGIPYTFFHCSFFLDSFPIFIEDGVFAIMGNYQHPVFYTNTTDLAKNITAAIDNPAAYNQAFSVQGKEGVNFVEAAKCFVAEYDSSVNVEVYPLETVRQLGYPEEQETFMHHMLSYVEQLSEKQVSEETWQLLGEPEYSIADFARSLKV
jgi:uncharacterized protein YbjT (DUF2867 family)